jgi:hypothetical protein
MALIKRENLFTDPMIQPFIFNRATPLSVRSKILLSLWSLFVVLVALGIHGSSTGVTADWWMPEKPYSAYLFWSPSQNQNDSDPATDARRDYLMARARWIRWDELMTATPQALAQLSHRPRFPVINTNVAAGQNMLINQHVPVWHLATLARPSTWGYFLLGAQRGLAWNWWFQGFACFTVLFLLLEIILERQTWLAAFGAFWFCASAYVVCWSMWPAYMTFFIALTCLSAYHLFQSEKRSTLAVCAVLFGLGLSGFVMFLYPPWQVSVGYLFLLLFIGLFIRDKLYATFKANSKPRLIAMLGAVAVTCVILGAYLITCLPDLKIMSATVYPGHRVSVGGDFSFALLFEGMYNLKTIYELPPNLTNQTETASFYYLFPAVILAMSLSKRFRERLGILGYLLAAYLLVLLFFLLVGLPEILAKLTLLSYVPPYRADVAIGLASIILCVQTLALVGKRQPDELSKWDQALPWVIGLLMVALLLWHGTAIRQLTLGTLSTRLIITVSVIGGLLTYLLLSARRRLFCALMAVIIVATTAFFNPLSTNLDHLYHSELAEQIVRFNKQSDKPPLWLCYGGVNPGILVTMLGGHSLSGAHWPPQVALWRKLDPSSFFAPVYNRFALVSLEYGEPNLSAKFTSPQEDAIVLTISPQLPILKTMGARYVLALGDAQQKVKPEGLTLVYRAANQSFSIYELQ